MSIWPLDWSKLVDEAVHRRKAEGHTQKSLAAVAGVSVPTVNAFEQGDIKLRLEKVFHILDALGMIKFPDAPGTLAAFMRSARQRWDGLVAPLDAGHPSRQPLGHVAYAYAIDADVDVPLGALRSELAHLRSTSGWPPFWVPTKEALKPIIRDGVVECWLGNPAADRAFSDAAHSDFWQVSGNLMAYLQRGYQEDGPSNLEPGTIFDLTLPVWRTAEFFTHILNLADALHLDADTRIAFETEYTGLEGRALVSWAAPLRRWTVGETHRSRTSAVQISMTTSLGELSRDLDTQVRNAVVPLYDLFDGFDASLEFVSAEVAEFQKSALRF